MVPNLKGSDEDPDGEGHSGSNHSLLAIPIVVPSTVDNDSGYNNPPSTTTTARPGIPTRGCQPQLVASKVSEKISEQRKFQYMLPNL